MHEEFAPVAADVLAYIYLFRSGLAMPSLRRTQRKLTKIQTLPFRWPFFTLSHVTKNTKMFFYERCIERMRNSDVTTAVCMETKSNEMSDAHSVSAHRSETLTSMIHGLVSCVLCSATRDTLRAFDD